MRVRGLVCTPSPLASVQLCRRFGPNGGNNLRSGLGGRTANRNGYVATFAPGPNCEHRDAGSKPYAEWCVFTVKGGR